MIDQDLITRAKSIDIDFGGGKTLKGLLEDMEREVQRNTEPCGICSDKLTVYETNKIRVADSFRFCPNCGRRLKEGK